ncbi:protein MpDP3 [Marchantia polymorpha subsp. ruderalis]
MDFIRFSCRLKYTRLHLTTGLNVDDIQGRSTALDSLVHDGNHKFPASSGRQACARRNNGLRPRVRRKLSRYSPESIRSEGKKDHTVVGGKSSSSESATLGSAPDNDHDVKLPQDPEDTEVIQFVGGSGTQGYQRRDSGRLGGRLKANNLSNLAAKVQTKLSHGSYCNLIELATEIHLEAKEKHNTTMRRIYDVVNVTEAVGCVERYVISRCGKKLKQGSKGSQVSGSLIRWCNSPSNDCGNAKAVAERLRNNLNEKEEELKSLAEEVELLESLMRHRQEKGISAEGSPKSIKDSQTSGSLEDSEHFSNQPPASKPHGISVPFYILKTSKESDDTNFEICTYTDKFGKEYQVALSSDHQFQQIQWNWVVKEVLSSSDSDFSSNC